METQTDYCHSPFAIRHFPTPVRKRQRTLWIKGIEAREAFRGGSRSKSGWRGHGSRASIWSGARSAICWDRSASAPTSGADGRAPAAATTRRRAGTGSGAAKRRNPRRCGGNGAGSMASRRCDAAATVEPRPLPRGVRCATRDLCNFSPPPLRRTAFLGYVRAELCLSRAYLRAGRSPSGPTAMSRPSRQPGPNQ
jgi:hypothetical protein